MQKTPRVLVAVAVLLTGGSCLPRHVGRPPTPTLWEEANAARKVTSLSAAGIGYGTAWLVDKDDVYAWWMTAGHVCEPDTLYTLKGVSDQSSIVLRVVVDSDAPGPDVCIMQTLTVPETPLRIATNVDYGEPVHYVGSPLATLRAGNAPLFRGTATGMDVDGNLLVSIPGYPGASGSAITNERGEVVGLLYAVTGLWPEMAFAVGHENLRALAAKYLPSYQ